MGFDWDIVTTRREYKRIFWDDETVLYPDSGSGYMKHIYLENIFNKYISL